MNQTPTTPETPTQKTSQHIIIIISLVFGILILLAGFGAYIWSQNLNMSNSGNNTSNSVISSMTNSALTSVDNSAKNSAKSIDEANNLKTLSCPSFDISINTEKYQVGFTKFADEFINVDRDEEGKVLLEKAKQELLLTQKINCIVKADESIQLVKFVEKGYENGCWYCGPGNIKSINLSSLNSSDSNKVLSTTLTKNTSGLEGVIKKMFYDTQYNTTVNYNAITFKIKDVNYEISTNSKTDNPTDAENEDLLKDALEVFNSIIVK